MEDNLEYIDRYFKGQLTPDELWEFEQRIQDEPAFAEEVAFYASALATLKAELAEEKKKRFRELYNQETTPVIGKPVRMLWRYVAAAAVVAGIILGSYLYFGRTSVSPPQLADKYIESNFTSLSVTMGKADSIQEGLGLYNDKHYDSALYLFEDILRRDAGNFSAKKYAGIVYLRMGNYDKALVYFRQLTEDSRFSNPAKLFQALTLLKRNQPDDKQAARLLLQQVVDENLEGKETAQQWLKKL